MSINGKKYTITCAINLFCGFLIRNSCFLAIGLGDPPLKFVSETVVD